MDGASHFGPEISGSADVPSGLGRPAGSVFSRDVVHGLSAQSVRSWVGQYHPEGGDGIGWIFQLGMGYTFYLPFAFYMAGLLCWSYTVIKLVTMGRIAGYGLALMFIAGYALLFSNLTLMVVLGVMFLTIDRYRRDAAESAPATNAPMISTPDTLVSGHI